MSELNEINTEMKEIFADYASLNTSFQQETFIELLKQLQENYGAVSKETQRLISEYFHIKPGVIQSIIKRFPSLTEYPYRHRIIVCAGQQCTSKESQELINHIKNELKNKPHNMFYLTKQYCFRKCQTAPNIKIDNDCYENVTIEKISQILDHYI